MSQVQGKVVVFDLAFKPLSWHEKVKDALAAVRVSAPGTYHIASFHYADVVVKHREKIVKSELEIGQQMRHAARKPKAAGTAPAVEAPAESGSRLSGLFKGR